MSGAQRRVSPEACRDAAPQPPPCAPLAPMWRRASGPSGQWERRFQPVGPLWTDLRHKLFTHPLAVRWPRGQGLLDVGPASESLPCSPQGAGSCGRADLGSAQPEVSPPWPPEASGTPGHPALRPCLGQEGPTLEAGSCWWFLGRLGTETHGSRPPVRDGVPVPCAPDGDPPDRSWP